MDFKRGYKIKPKSIESTGEVIFTDGTNEVFANEIVCRGYGYEYDKNLGVCYAFRYSKDASKQNTHQSLSIKGANNEAQSGTENSIIIGTKNKTLGDVQNSIVAGKNNEIDNTISNSMIIGTFGKSLNNGELVIGGGANNEEDGEVTGLIQTSFIQMNINSTSATPVNMIVQKTSDTDLNIGVEGYIRKLAGSINHLTIDIIALCTGGSSGTPGQFKTFQIVGTAKISADGSTTTYTQNATQDNGVNTVASGYFNATSSGISVVNAHNLTASRTSTGVYALSFVVPRADANYIVLGQIIEPNTTRDDIKIHVEDGTQAVDGFSVRIYEGDNGGSPDTARDRKFYVSVLDFEASGGLSLITYPTLTDSPVDGGITIQCTGLANTNINWYASVKMVTLGTTQDF